MDSHNIEHIWVLMAKSFSGEASEEELLELDNLLRQHPSINYSKEILHDFWTVSPAQDRQDAENKYRKLVQQIKNIGIDEGKFTEDEHFINADEEVITTNGRKKKWLIAAASFLIISLTGLLFIYSNKQKPNTDIPESHAQNKINTKSGSKTNLVLPDGTKVWLNASSQLTYEKSYGNSLREVTLTGEAYFDVVKNKEKPFIIHTAKMDIKVLGTAFNVKCYPGEKTTETSLVRGSIEVTLKDRLEKIMMKPNEKLVINQDDIPEKNSDPSVNEKSIPSKVKAEKPIITLTHLTLLPRDNTIIETAWIQNRLVFSSETFEEVALKMERWYNVKINIKNESLKQEPLTGNFEKETISEALTALQFSTKFHYNINNNSINIYK